ncbi:ubiquitin-conjugating enzyme E2 1 [Artemisia annua]|uniref:Ubiquitin-conjugating enzyme E2 1 n=1 Tax=Artemisia annua TaxID=35608 RepID=A0A2U1MQB2_ARTAN|nr:ubiquitin-conjugating enzyme E2 1 [Artemisia annua]
MQAPAREKRIQGELQDFNKKKSLLGGITLTPDPNDIHHLTATIPGPDSSPYHGGVFHIDITLPDTYPCTPPEMRFTTKVWHPNISSETGAFCVDKNSWTPIMTLRSVLISLKALLSVPEPNDSQDDVVSEQYLTDHATFTAKALCWTEDFAMVSSPEYNRKVQKLIEMGFPEALVKKTLEAVGGHVIVALEKLYYPLTPPEMRFTTKVWHPNISSETGAFCLDKNSWTPAMTLRSVLISLQALLSVPEPNDPQDNVVAEQYLTDHATFTAIAMCWTEDFAMVSSPEYNRKVQKLIEMGFPEALVRKTLEAVGGHVIVALENHHPWPWTPSMNLITALISLQVLLSVPEPKDPQDDVVAEQYLTDHATFTAIALCWTEDFAMVSSPEYNRKVQKLIEMGFPEALVKDIGSCRWSCNSGSRKAVLELTGK